MNIKKIILAVSLVAATSQIQAVGETQSILLGLVCGPVHECLIADTPAWVSVPAVPVLLVVQQLVFNKMRELFFIEEVRKLGPWRASDDQCYNELLSFSATIVAALATYGIEKYTTKKEEEESAANLTKEAGLV